MTDFDCTLNIATTHQDISVCTVLLSCYDVTIRVWDCKDHVFLARYDHATAEDLFKAVAIRRACGGYLQGFDFAFHTLDFYVKADELD